MKMNSKTTATTARTCAFCEEPIPAERSIQAIYCHPNCRRKAVYHRKSPEERSEINKRSNTRRFQKDLLPRLRSISKVPAEIPPGSPVAVWVVQRVLLERFSCWKWDHALNFLQAREALAELAGGFEALNRIETELNEQIIDLMHGKADAA